MMILVSAIVGFLMIACGKADDTDRVEFRNCGPPSMNLTIAWYPKLLYPLGSYTFISELTTVTDFQEKGGQICTTIHETSWGPDMPPLFDACTDVTCWEVKENVKKYWPGAYYAECPIQAGKKWSTYITNYIFPTTFLLPSGDYVLRAKLLNSRGEVFLCFEGEFQYRE